MGLMFVSILYYEFNIDIILLGIIFIFLFGYYLYYSLIKGSGEK